MKNYTIQQNNTLIVGQAKSLIDFMEAALTEDNEIKEVEITEQAHRNDIRKFTLWKIKTLN